MKNKKLTFLESVALVAGAGIGTGILTIPYAIGKIGVYGALTALAFSYALSAVMYLMIADLTRNSSEPEDIVSILNEHLFHGKENPLLQTVFPVLLALMLLENLVVYLLCAGNILTDLFGISGILSKLLFYLLASAVVLFGVKGMGIGEKYSVLLIGCAVGMLTVLSCFHLNGALDFSFGNPGTVFAVFGLFMFSFSAIFSIFQVCNHIEKKELAGKAVIGGLTLNALITLSFTAAVLLGSDTVTEIATIGLSESIGIPAVRILCSVLVLLAMFTSLWSNGFAFSDVIRRKFGISSRIAWFIATVPARLISVFLPLTALDYIKIGAGVLSFVLVLVVLPAYRNAVKNPKITPLLGKLSGSKALLAVMAVGMVLMAISSVVPIK